MAALENLIQNWAAVDFILLLNLLIVVILLYSMQANRKNVAELKEEIHSLRGKNTTLKSLVNSSKEWKVDHGWFEASDLHRKKKSEGFKIFAWIRKGEVLDMMAKGHKVIYAEKREVSPETKDTTMGIISRGGQVLMGSKSTGKN